LRIVANHGDYLGRIYFFYNALLTTNFRWNPRCSRPKPRDMLGVVSDSWTLLFYLWGCRQQTCSQFVITHITKRGWSSFLL